MIGKISVFIACATALLAAPAQAVDLGKALVKPPLETLTSHRSLFDLERCIILMDGPLLPSVYRQPDRPGYTLIGYSTGLGVPLLIELKAEGTGTRITVHANGMGVKRIPDGLTDCVNG